MEGARASLDGLKNSSVCLSSSLLSLQCANFLKKSKILNHLDESLVLTHAGFCCLSSERELGLWFCDCFLLLTKWEALDLSLALNL